MRSKLILVLASFVAITVIGVAGYERSLAQGDRSAVNSSAGPESGTTTTFTPTVSSSPRTEPTSSDAGASDTKPVERTVVETTGFDDKQTGVVIPDDVEIWHRENGYMVGHLGNVQDRPPLALGNHVASPEDNESKAFRVLVVGDSYVWGFGMNDLDRVWHRVLANKLAERFGAGSYHFTSVSHIGTSMMSYSENLSAEAIKAHDPDLIVIGFLPNDWLADGSERRICAGKATTDTERLCQVGAWYTRPDYVKCLEGRSNLVGAFLRRVVKPFFPRAAISLTERMCDPKSYPMDPLSPEEVQTMLKNPDESVYWPMFKDAIKDIRRNAGSVPVLALPTSTNSFPIVPVVYETLRQGGIKVIDNPKTKAVMKAGEGKGEKAQWVNPADPHPNTVLHNAYALDSLDYIARYYPNPVTDSDYDMALVSNYAPSSLTYTADGDRVKFSHDPNSSLTRQQTARNDYRTVPRPAQSVPCAPFGRPHSRVVFNSQVLTQPVTARITLEKTEQPLVISTVSYDSTGREIISKPVPLAVGVPFERKVDRNTTGFIIGSTVAGCAVDKVLELGSFDLTVVKR